MVDERDAKQERVVFKYPLGPESTQAVSMPEGARILAIQEQRGRLCIWAEVNPRNPVEKRRFDICGTGNPLPKTAARYVATCQARDNWFVWHVYEHDRHSATDTE